MDHKESDLIIIDEEEGVIEVDGEIRVPSYQLGFFEYHVFETMRPTRKELNDRIREATEEFAKDGWEVVDVRCRRIRVEDRTEKVHHVEMTVRKGAFPGGFVWVYEN